MKPDWLFCALLSRLLELSKLLEFLDLIFLVFYSLANAICRDYCCLNFLMYHAAAQDLL